MSDHTMTLDGEIIQLMTEEDIRHSATLEKMMARLAAEGVLTDEELEAVIHVTSSFEHHIEHSNAVKATIPYLRDAMYGKGVKTAAEKGSCRTIWEAAEAIKELTKGR